MFRIFNKKSFLDEIGIDKSDWTQLFSACVGRVYLLQNRCARLVVKGQNWNTDFDEGKIYFGEDGFDFQFIGSESQDSNTWLWGFENINGFDERLLALANQMRGIGEKWGLDALSTAEFELDDNFNGHNLSIVTCGLSEREMCYYRCAYEGGAAFVAFDAGVCARDAVGASEFIETVNACISTFELDHGVFLRAFLVKCGVKFSQDKNQIIAKFDNEAVFELDEQGRICNMNFRYS